MRVTARSSGNPASSGGLQLALDAYLSSTYTNVTDRNETPSPLYISTAKVGIKTLLGAGTVSNGAGGTTVTGVGTTFLTTFSIGDFVTIGGQQVAISAIASDTSMTTAAITNANAAGTAYYIVSKFVLENVVPATSGNQMYSPAIEQVGYGYTSSSKKIGFRYGVVPTSGTAGYWAIDSSVDGALATYTNTIKIFNNGVLELIGPTAPYYQLSRNATVGWYVQSLSSRTEYYSDTFHTFNASVAIGTVTASAKLHVVSTTEQLRLGYDVSNYASLTVGSSGVLSITSSSGVLDFPAAFNAFSTISTRAGSTVLYLKHYDSGVENGRYTMSNTASSGVFNWDGTTRANVIGAYSGTAQVYILGGSGANTGRQVYIENTTTNHITGSRSVLGVLTNPYVPASGTGTWNILELYGSITAAGASASNFRGAVIDYTINNTGAQTGTATGILLNATETALNGMTHNLMDLQVGGVSKFRVSNAGIVRATLQSGNAGLATGDWYYDTAANILANGDTIIGRKA